jgi:hypothetical protein
MSRNRVTPLCRLLRHCDASQNGIGLIPDGISGSFHLLNFFGRNMALGSTQLLKEMSTRVFSAGKGGRCVGLTILPSSCPNRLEILGASNYWRPKGSRGCHEMKDAYPFIIICDESRDEHSQLRLKRRLNCNMSTKENVILCWTISCVNWQLLLLKCFSRGSL